MKPGYYDDWLTKEEAARVLEVTTKTVEKFAAEKKIQSARIKRTETGATIVKFHPKDVAKLRKERLPDAAPFVVPKDVAALGASSAGRFPALPANMESAGQLVGRTIAEHITKAAEALFTAHAERPPAVPLHRRLFLTRTEAADYSGLPRSEITFRIKSQELRAFRTGRGWRILRRDLERFCAGFDGLGAGQTITRTIPNPEEPAPCPNPANAISVTDP